MNSFIDNNTNTNCKGCINCIGCYNCENCENCLGCTNCQECSNCMSILNSKNCTYCKYCDYCQDCSQCEECIECYECLSCEGGIALLNAIGYFAFDEAKFSFPKVGCTPYNFLVENFFINQRFKQYNSSEFRHKHKEGKLIAWNYGHLSKHYWIAINSDKPKFEIWDLFNFIEINKLYYD